MKATHYGTCQVCGSFQKAPGNRIAAHGFTIKLGFQQGICSGSNQLPFEVSKDYAEEVFKYISECVAAFIETPRPQATVAYWQKCPKVEAWKEAQILQRIRKGYIKERAPILANWAPRSQKKVEEVEAVEASAKAIRAEKTAASKALKAAKAELNRVGEILEKAVDKAINADYYAAKRAFYEANSVGFYPGLPKEVPFWSVGRLKKLVSLAEGQGLDELIAEITRLAASYEALKAQAK